MDSSFWLKCWERNTLGFHQREVHPFLPQYFKHLALPTDKHVLVPLCGKSTDMAYLAQFMQVTGNELSEIACRDFFIDNNIPFEKKALGEFEHYSADQLSLYQGDFFKFSPELIGSVDWIYDRAALIALPEKMQQQYVEHLKHFFSSDTRLFLVTLEFPKAQLSGPPFAIDCTEVSRLFSTFDVECIATNEISNNQFAQRTFAVDYLLERLYIIKPKV